MSFNLKLNKNNKRELDQKLDKRDKSKAATEIAKQSANQKYKVQIKNCKTQNPERDRKGSKTGNFDEGHHMDRSMNKNRFRQRKTMNGQGVQGRHKLNTQTLMTR